LSLKVHKREVDRVEVLDLEGRITIGDSSVTLRDLVRDEVNQGKKKLLLNLAGCTYIDSAGLGELISAFTTVKNRGGELKLLNLTKRIHDLMQITKLYTVFDIYDNEATAVASFGA